MARRPLGPLQEVVLVLLLTSIAFVLSRPASPTAHAATPRAGSTAAQVADDAGAFLYGRDCAGCHGPEGEGSPRGVSLTGSGEAGAHYMLLTGRMPIEDPEAPIRRSAPRYSDEQIDALVAHVAGLGDGPALPDVDPAEGDVPRGGELYRLHCGMCHSATGIGGALAFDEFAPSVTDAEPSVVAAAITAGPGAMPSFRPIGFTDDELTSIVAYVDQLQDPEDRGGIPIFRAGRADEGMVAWLVGVPTMVLLAAWVARRVR